MSPRNTHHAIHIVATSVTGQCNILLLNFNFFFLIIIQGQSAPARNPEIPVGTYLAMRLLGQHQQFLASVQTHSESPGLDVPVGRRFVSRTDLGHPSGGFGRRRRRRRAKTAVPRQARRDRSVLGVPVGRRFVSRTDLGHQLDGRGRRRRRRTVLGHGCFQTIFYGRECGTTEPEKRTSAKRNNREPTMADGRTR